MNSPPTNHLESSLSPAHTEQKPGIQAWIKVSLIAAASALAGGLAAAWFYRNTLRTLQDARPGPMNSEPRIPEGDTEPEP